MSNVKMQIVDFIQKHAPKNGVVLGVSGGIDSALVLALCVQALGKDNVLALFMPENSRDIGDTIKQYVASLGVRSETLPIKPIFETYIKQGGVADNRLVVGNLKARIRMTLLYTRSNANGLVVMGTGNRTELLMGYFTKYGDGGVDYLPIGALYKTEVRQLAKEMGVPDEIIAQPPTAGLWPGQTDEQELGISYEKLDQILTEHTDKGVSFDQINLPGISRSEIQIVQKRLDGYGFKTTPTLICQLTK